MRIFKKIIYFIAQLIDSWSRDNVSTYSAALAYYTLFALAPLLIICTTLVGLFINQDIVQKQIIDNINLIMGHDSAHQIQTMIQQSQTPTNGLLTSIISFFVLLFGASGVFGQIQLGLNAIWGVDTSQNQGFLRMIKNRFLSFTLVIGIAFLLLVSLIISTCLTIMSGYIDFAIPGGIFIASSINFIISLGVITLLFAMIFKLLPDKVLAWSEVMFGAFMTALLFSLGKYLLSNYLGKIYVANAFGPAGSLIVILVWVYYSAQILFIGAEISKIHAAITVSNVMQK
jgi:membrane protein